MSVAVASRTSPVKVMLVDDSSVVRGLMKRWLDAEDGIEVVALATNGRDAIRMAKDAQPDVIVLDIEMPEIDGITAIPQLLAASRCKILMASGLTRRNAEISIRALTLGAADYIPKPETGGINGAADFKRDLITKIRALGVKRAPALARFSAAAPAGTVRSLPPGFSPQVLVIGSSTGGPQALQAIVQALGAPLVVPVLVVQHMPPMFTAILADHLSKVWPGCAEEARDGAPLKGGMLYVAPGDNHMRIVKKAGQPYIALDKSPAINFCRPSVDPLFSSAAEAYGSHVLGLVLTGMGSDGRQGSQDIVSRGGAIMAQDEASSVVWGMPGAVVRAGLAAQVRPLLEIAPSLLSLIRRKL
jgi:two-component system chemotaxis response regulator CheB